MDQNFQPPVSSSPLPTPSEHHKIGPIVGVVIIIILLILAALYFWSQKLNVNSNLSNETNSTYSQSSTPNSDAAAQVSAEKAVVPTKTAEEAKVDTELGLDGLDDLNDLNF